jgi:pSer/pThr/pTyr-binding forkhead associated (FHA) protein
MRLGWPVLSFTDDRGHQRLVELDDSPAPTVIGRSPDAHVVLHWDHQVSRVHATIEAVGEDRVISDDGLSSNGTFVNDERVTGRRRLRDGDVIRVGETKLEFRAGDAALGEATVPTPVVDDPR